MGFTESLIKLLTQPLIIIFVELPIIFAIGRKIFRDN